MKLAKATILSGLTVILVLSIMLSSCTQSMETTTEDADSQLEQVITETDLDTTDGEDRGIKQVMLENDKFTPYELTVNVGDSIEWVNLDDSTHTITFEDGTIDVEIAAGSTVTYTFEEAGQISYFSLYSPSTNGMIYVEE